MREQTPNTLRDITERLGWTSTKKILGQEFGVTAVGLAPFVERLAGLREDDGREVDVDGVVDTLWRKLLLSGTRLVKLYNLDQDILLQIQSSLSSQEPDQSEFCVSYPIPLSKEQLYGADTDLHYVETVTSLISTAYDIENPNGSLEQNVQIETTILTSKAYYTDIIELDASHLSEAGLELRSNGGEIKCKTRDVTQCFNTVMVIPAHNILALTVDLSVMPRSESERQQYLVEQFIRAVTGVTLPPPIDLFCLVQEMYEQRDGRVSEMSFITSDGNVSSLKLKPGQSCLRSDSYHHGGESASPILTKYKLGKLWDLRQSASLTLPVELVLPGKRAMIDKPNSHLYDAVIDRCSNIEQVYFVIGKMLISLNNIKKKLAEASTA
ncbi:hypothetical protein KSU19_00365 [Enterobacter quasiroggenkampii]|uniref:hypothetical protein n=1 Tax=Enterobacter quasiroggenkampii TaxID=2497436 RepID=UPI0021D270A9|nr:hypothetical protein [Enterobacter quasiroggenkampii]MCU6326091.1 hypothetical protein [Enterobacter quasiroggenkampii]